MLPLIIANWKANKTAEEAMIWMDGFARTRQRDNATYVIAPPTALLGAVRERALQLGLMLGAQDVSSYPAGAYTGEVPARSLASMGVQYVIVGHSERRRYFHEDSVLVAEKIRRVLEANMYPVVCVDVPEFRPQADQLNPDERARCIVAYEPVHAISTFGGQEDPLAVTLENVQQLREAFGNVPVLYGGSVKPDNALAYIQSAELQGVLVGGSSLDAATFTAL